MLGRILFSIALVLALVLAPGVAHAELFDNIHTKQRVTIVLPAGQCDARVVTAAQDLLTLRLDKTTSACGLRQSMVTLSRNDVKSIVDNRPSGRRLDPSNSSAGICAALGAALVGGTAGVYLGETGHDGLTLASIAGGAIAGAAICHAVRFSHVSRYSVFAVRIALLGTASQNP